MIAKLIELGKVHEIHGRNPISFCNVLFLGNTIAFFTLCLLYWKDIKDFRPKKISAKGWSYCLISAILTGFFYPTLFFLGISYANVVNVIIISTLDIPITLLFGWLFFREKVDGVVLFGAAFIMAGVLFGAVFHQTSSHLKCR